VGDWEGYGLNAAKLIKIGIDKGLKRQVFYMSLSFSGVLILTQSRVGCMERI